MSIRATKKFDRGYVALVAVLIISSLSLMAVSTISFGGFNVLSSVLNRENKELSLSLSLSCLDQAILRIVQSPSWEPKPDGDKIFINDLSCLIKEIEQMNEEFKIKIFANVGGAETSIEAVARIEFNNNPEVEIISIREI